MKNFRKVLALVLVMATLFSFTAMAGAAYKDAADVSYDEAVDVLSAVGILNGYEDGTFKPTATISREEMAKMIAVLANAGDDVSTLYATATSFADVPAERWSASYVAYCAKTGIVAGRSASTFDPTGKVTGLETAKMLLVLLGFSAEEQGYVGADWKVNVLRDAKVMGLLNNFAAGYDVDAAITREEAAQMMLNALEAPCVVGVVNKGLVEITNALIVEWPGASNNLTNLLNVTAWAKLKDAMDAGKWCLYGNVVISNDELAYRLFGLTKVAYNEGDCYDRPGSGWKWVDAKGNTYAFGGYNADPVWSSHNTTYNGIVKALSAYDTVGKDGKVDYTVSWYSDGVEASANKEDFGGKGALVELYVIEKGEVDELRVVEINTYVNYIAEVDTYDKTVSIGEHKDANTFGLKTVDTGKIALYWICDADQDNKNNDIHGVELITPVATAKVTKAVKNNTTAESYFVAGDKYEYAKNFDVTIAEDLKVMGELVEGANYGVGAEWDIYVDNYGFVVYYAPAGSAVEYKYAVVDYGTANKFYQYTNKVNGEVWTYEASLVEFEDNAAPGAAVDVTEYIYNRVDKTAVSASDTLIKYYIDGNGNVASSDVIVNTNRVWVADSTDVLKASDMYEVDGYYMSEDTQILVRVENPMTGKHEYKYFDGCDEIDAVYDVDNMAYYHAGRHITYLYAEAEYAFVSGYAYMLGAAESIVYLTDGNQVVGYNTYNAIVNGEEAVIATKLQKITKFNTVYGLNMVCIGLTTDDNAPVYVNLYEAPGLTPATEVETLEIEAGKLFYSSAEKEDELIGKLDSKAQFMMFFTPSWSDMDYTTITAAELVEYVSNWNHANVWTFDLDADGDIDLLYVNAADGDKD